MENTTKLSQVSPLFAKVHALPQELQDAVMSQTLHDSDTRKTFVTALDDGTIECAALEELRQLELKQSELLDKAVEYLFGDSLTEFVIRDHQRPPHQLLRAFHKLVKPRSARDIKRLSIQPLTIAGLNLGEVVDKSPDMGRVFVSGESAALSKYAMQCMSAARIGVQNDVYITNEIHKDLGKTMQYIITYFNPGLEVLEFGLDVLDCLPYVPGRKRMSQESKDRNTIAYKPATLSDALKKVVEGGWEVPNDGEMALNQILAHLVALRKYDKLGELHVRILWGNFFRERYAGKFDVEVTKDEIMRLEDKFMDALGRALPGAKEVSSRRQWT